MFISGLWKRLNASTEFPFILNFEIKQFIWDIICVVDEIECYLLPQPRPELTVTDKPDTVDIIQEHIKKVKENNATCRKHESSTLDFSHRKTYTHSTLSTTPSQKQWALALTTTREEMQRKS